MSIEYFSDRERGVAPRVGEVIGLAAWGGFVAIIQSRISDGSLGIGFPDICVDGRGTTGTNGHALSLSLKAEIPGIEWPFDTEKTPSTLAILDAVEFVFRHVGKPSIRDHHDFFGHDHLVYDRVEGRAEFSRDINRILARNGLAFELGSDGQVVRLASPILREALATSAFRTGDRELDAMLESARKKFLDPDSIVRREALEKLWDAWERLKTLLPGADKKASAAALLDQASSEASFRSLLEAESKQLTSVGNTFQIRHSETTQVQLSDTAHVDYLFHRLFALIRMLLRKSGRM